MQCCLQWRSARRVPKWWPHAAFIAVAADGEFHLHGVNAARGLPVMARNPAAFEATVDDMAITRAVRCDGICERRIATGAVKAANVELR